MRSLLFLSLFAGCDSTPGTKFVVITETVPVEDTGGACQLFERRLLDLDLDGYGDPDNFEMVGVCEPWLPGYQPVIEGRNDCDDHDPEVYPGAADRDSLVDCMADRDRDGYGDDGHLGNLNQRVVRGTDCDDGYSPAHPGARNYCYPGDDLNCNNLEDTLEEECLPPDQDGDGYDSLAAGGTDCDDLNASVSPLALERCNGLDDDCDNVVDESSAFDAQVWYEDVDLDTYGNPSVAVVSCDAPAGYVGIAYDCNDLEPSANPLGIEVCGGGIDEDCDGLIDTADNPECPSTTSITVTNIPVPLDVVTHGASGVLVLRLSLTAGSLAGATLTDISFEITSDDTDGTVGWDNLPNPADRFTSCQLVDELGNTVGDPENVSGNELTFSNVNFSIEEADTQTLDLVCDVSLFAIMNGTDDAFAFVITDTASMTFEDSDFGTLVTDILVPDGLPNSDLSSSLVVTDDGEIVMSWNGPLAGTVLPGSLDQPLLTVLIAGLSEDALVEELEYQLTGDLNIVSLVRVSYRDLEGYIVTRASVPDPAGTVRFAGLDLLAESASYNVDLIFDVDASALPGESITAAFVPNGMTAIGLDSGAVLTVGTDITPSANIVGYPQSVQ